MVVQVQVVFDELVKARKWLEFQELEEPLLLFYVLVEDHELELEEVVQSHEIVEVEMVGLDAMEGRHVVQVQMMLYQEIKAHQAAKTGNLADVHL